jgi:hypothetical protein
MVAMSIFFIVNIASKARFASPPPAESASVSARGDLPGEAPAVLAPTAHTFLAAIADDRVPVAIRLFLIVRHDLKGKGFAEHGVRAVTEQKTDIRSHLSRRKNSFITNFIKDDIRKCGFSNNIGWKEPRCLIKPFGPIIAG